MESAARQEERQQRPNYLPHRPALTNLYIVTHISALSQNVVVLGFEISLLLFRSQDVLHLPDHAVQRPSKVKKHTHTHTHPRGCFKKGAPLKPLTGRRSDMISHQRDRYLLRKRGRTLPELTG